jgi:two-component system LytT family response regulator
MKAIIIDDESQARKLLKNLLKEYCPQVEVIADCEDLPNGVKAIRKLKPELVFLDIEMPGHSGLELVDFFDDDDIHFGIIFTTAYNQYAVKAFKLSAVDYLLKPIDGEELINAVARYEKSIFKKESIQLLKENLNAVGLQKIAVPVGQSVRFILLSDIVFFKAENSYTEIFMHDETKLTVSRTLKNFEDTLLDNPIFFRCHKSYIVNQDYIIDYVKSDGGYLVLKPKHEIPISHDKVDQFLKQTTIVKR